LKHLWFLKILPKIFISNSKVTDFAKVIGIHIIFLNFNELILKIYTFKIQPSVWKISKNIGAFRLGPMKRDLKYLPIYILDPIKNTYLELTFHKL